MLVDPSKAAQLYRPTITDRKLSALDKDISETLNSQEPDDVKAKRYLAALKQHRYYDMPTPAKLDDSDTVVQAIDPQVRTKAKRLLKRIKPHLRLSDEGELVHNKDLIEHSDISELLASATSRSTDKNPKGWIEFADTLKRARVPRELIDNDKLWKYMNPLSKITLKKRKWEEFS